MLSTEKYSILNHHVSLILQVIHQSVRMLNRFMKHEKKIGVPKVTVEILIFIFSK